VWGQVLNKTRKMGEFMKITRMWYVLGLLSLGRAAWSQAQQTAGVEKAVAANAIRQA
jgi:hypothetical protein